jgi:F-type H+-transporting ATPase subunit delta
MNESKIPVRYARALFLHGKEMGILDKLAGDITLLAGFFEKTPALMPWLRSPVVRMQAKKDMLHKNFDRYVSETTIRFVDLVISKKRERYLPDMFRDFLGFYKADAGIKTFVLTTATGVDISIINKLNQEIKREGMPDHELITRVRPAILGGFMLQADDMLFDASVSTSLKKLKKELTTQIREL